MPAPLNNTNALKYTPAVVLQHLADIEREAANADMLYLGMVFAKLRISRKAWAYWKQRFTAALARLRPQLYGRPNMSKDVVYKSHLKSVQIT